MALERGDVGFVLGLAGFLLGGAGLGIALTTQTKVEGFEPVLLSDGEMLEGIVNRVSELERSSSGVQGVKPVTRDEFTKYAADLAEANKRISAAAKDGGFTKDEVAGLRARISEIEKLLPK
jgi:hypothetical protein